MSGVRVQGSSDTPPPSPLHLSDHLYGFFKTCLTQKLLLRLRVTIQFLNFLSSSGRKEQNSYEFFFFFLIFYLKSDRNLHPSQPYIRCRVVIGQVISLIPLIQLSFVQ